MLRRTLGLILRTQQTSTASVRTEIPDSDITMESPDDASTEPCLFLDALPPEIRIHIYGYLVLSEHRLIPYNDRKLPQGREKPEEALQPEPKGRQPLDLSVLLLNKQIYAEAADIFYSFNKFTTHYDDFCFCWRGKHVSLDKAHIKHFKIQGINFDEEWDPRLWSRCRVCDTQGFWLMKSLNSLPELTSVALAFQDVESYSSCLITVNRKLRQLGKNARLEAGEIGRVFTTGTHTQFELRLPSLLRTWPHALARAAEECVDGYDSDDEDWPLRDLPHMSEQDEGTYLAIRDVLYHAIAFNSTTMELQPLMQKVVSPDGLHMERLCPQEKAEFTIVLAGCLADIIADDENVHMADRKDLVELSQADDDEKNRWPRASTAVSRRLYSYTARF
jgi:hypothetical protein